MKTPHAVVVALLVISATPAWAGLKEKPPKGVAMTGVWQLDPYRSDDPKAVVENARSKMQESGGSRPDGERRRGRGGMGGGGGGFPGGGGGFPGGGGGGFPGGGRGGDGGGSDGGSDDGGSSGRGGWRHGRDGSGHERPDGQNGAGGPGQRLNELAANPARLSFALNDHTLKVLADDASTECAAGVKVAISDEAGSAERNCGWSGRAWTIETTRGKDFKRTDSYEISKDGKTLTYVTTASGGRLPKIKITRLYTLGDTPPTS